MALAEAGINNCLNCAFCITTKIPTRDGGVIYPHCKLAHSSINYVELDGHCPDWMLRGKFPALICSAILHISALFPPPTAKEVKRFLISAIQHRFSR